MKGDPMKAYRLSGRLKKGAIEMALLGLSAALMLCMTVPARASLTEATARPADAGQDLPPGSPGPALNGLIAVDFGAYPTAQQAAVDEANVNWNDADPADDTVCTASFAAVELQEYLRRLTGASQGWAIINPAHLSPSRDRASILISTFDELPPP